MKRLVSKGLVVVVGFLGAPPGVVVSGVTSHAGQYLLNEDPRQAQLEKFFGDRECPAKAHVADFLRAADEHGLDWRLLPTLSFIESGGGRVYRNNNIFGWQNGEKRFPSVRAGIHVVAERVANSEFYKDKDLDGMLKSYNSFNPKYGEVVKDVMRDMGPESFN